MLWGSLESPRGCLAQSLATWAPLLERPEGKIGSLGLIEPWPDRFLKKTVGKGEGEWGFSRTQMRQEEATGRVYECGLGVIGQLAVHGGSNRSRVSSGSH